MPLSFDTRLSFSDPDIQQYLEDDQAPLDYAVKPSAGADFEHDVNDQRPSGEPLVHTQQVIFLAEEKYRLLEQGNPVGFHQVTVALRHDIDMRVAYWLFVRSALSGEIKTYIRARFHEYDPVQHGDDVIGWMRANLGGQVTEDDFDVSPCLELRKQNAAAQDHNVSQRDALFSLFGLNGMNPPPNNIPIVGDYTMRSWAHERDLNLVLIDRTLIADQSGPAKDPNLVVQVADASDQQEAGNAIDAILAPIISVDCGEMQREQIQLLTLGAWPEFMIEWKPVRIRIGCSRITIWVPVLRTRISRLVFYAYFKIPLHIDRLIFTIARTCAIRSALTSAVIGIVTSNIAAAVASFTPLMKRCLEQEIRNCLYPGLLLATEPGPWT